MSQYIWTLVKAAITLFAAAGGWAWLGNTLAKNAAIEKNENIKTAMTFASQMVIRWQAFSMPGSDQQKGALDDLISKLNVNGLAKKFTEEQAMDYIKQAYAINKANGQLDQVTKKE